VSIEGSCAVAVGIDAAVVANHHVVARRTVAGGSGDKLEQFVVAPTLSGLSTLTELSTLTGRLAAYPGALAVAEPTSMTWLPLAVALGNAGGSLALIGNRHSTRLRSALAGKNKSDPIDAEGLSRAADLFSLDTAWIPEPAELALRRAVQRRHKVLIDSNRSRWPDGRSPTCGTPRAARSRGIDHWSPAVAVGHRPARPAPAPPRRALHPHPQPVGAALDIEHVQALQPDKQITTIAVAVEARNGAGRKLTQRSRPPGAAGLVAAEPEASTPHYTRTPTVTADDHPHRRSEEPLDKSCDRPYN
jgi:hypothetical protein